MTEVAVLGYGTVGSGVVEVLERNAAVIEHTAGDALHVKYVLDIRDFPGDPIQERITHDFNQILDDPDIKVIAEVMGGVEPAYSFTKQALEKGKSVCTSNKELVARYGSELLSLARDKGVNYLFEASCGGGIPIIAAINQSLIANEIDEITGILNGTTNYILSEMAESGSAFEDALADAQEKGYAERNPEADVEGHDACRKLAILSSLCFGKRVNYEDIYTEGITAVTHADILYAKELGMAVKLLASGWTVPEGDTKRFYALVAPFLVSPENPLFSVNGVFNAVFVHGNMLGDAMFYGSGAGKLPTASAVAGDMIEAVRRAGETIMTFDSTELLPITAIENESRRFFVRIPKEREEAAEKAFGEIKIVTVPELSGETGFVTEEMTEKAFEECAEKAGGIISRIRIK
ncbi:MAG: homoserine dehydrogenase [Lachnospiraceae bacterium]|nr:homoserine dehydrogenase [Lachnospiraceae bacterium]